MKNDKALTVSKSNHCYLNRTFSLASYSEPWTKLERYLFIEVYNIIKCFYEGSSDKSITHYDVDTIGLKLPISQLNKEFFGRNRLTQLEKTSRTLSKKQISFHRKNAKGKLEAFSFITLFPKIAFDKKIDKKHLHLFMMKEVFEEMIPIESYASLNLKILGKLNSGNAIRLYEIIKSYSFKEVFTLEFDELRAKMGFLSSDNNQ